MGINYKHIEALFRHYLKAAEFDGQRFITDGHVMVRFNGEFSPPSSVGAMPISANKIWNDALSDTSKQLNIGRLLIKSSVFVREIGLDYIQEKYYRCFQDCLWRQPNGLYTALTASDATGMLLGLVMPYKVYPPLKKSKDQELSDEDLFGQLASRDNGWYMARDCDISNQIRRLSEEETEWEEKLEEAQSELEAIRSNLEELEQLQSTRAGKVHA